MQSFCLLLLVYCIILATMQCASETDGDGLRMTASGILSEWWQDLCICQIYPLSFKAMKYSVGNLFDGSSALKTSQLCAKIDAKRDDIMHFEDIEEEANANIFKTCMQLYGCNVPASDLYKYRHLEEYCKRIKMEEVSFPFYLRSTQRIRATHDNTAQKSRRNYKSVTMLANHRRHRPMSRAKVGAAAETAARPSAPANEEDGFNMMIALMLPRIAVTSHSQERGMENREVSWEQGQDPGARNGDTRQSGSPHRVTTFHPSRVSSEPLSSSTATSSYKTKTSPPVRSPASATGGPGYVYAYRQQFQTRGSSLNETHDHYFKKHSSRMLEFAHLHGVNGSRRGAASETGSATLKASHSAEKSCCDKVYRDLIDTKMDPSRIKQQGFRTRVVNERVHAVTRDIPGNKMCVVIFNKGKRVEEVDLNNFSVPTNKLGVFEICSANFTKTAASMLTTSKISIGPQETLVAEVGPLETKISTVWINPQPEYSLPHIYFSTFILILSSHLMNA